MNPSRPSRTTTTENQISFSRQHYNATVLDYNTAIQTFPAVLIAGMLGFTKRDFFDAEPEAANVPNVLLAGPLGFTKREFFDAEPEAANVPNVDLSLS